ncbi:MAG: PH domain-containing protein [bacterium]|nr:PH domain-containing protein [bacterium]
MSFWQQFLGFNPNQVRQFPGQQPGEETHVMTSGHWILLTPLLLHTLLTAAVLIYLNGFSAIFLELSFQMRFLVNTVILALLYHYMFMRLFNHFLHVLIITNFRIIDVRASIFFKREREVIPFTNIQDFRMYQNGILPRIFKYGDLILLGSSTDIRYNFSYIPHVNRVYYTMGEIHQKVAPFRQQTSTESARASESADNPRS